MATARNAASLLSKIFNRYNAKYARPKAIQNLVAPKGILNIWRGNTGKNKKKGINEEALMIQTTMPLWESLTQMWSFKCGQHRFKRN
jgi:hypothetical protein